jgi:hypothetical protein
MRSAGPKAESSVRGIAAEATVHEADVRDLRVARRVADRRAAAARVPAQQAVIRQRQAGQAIGARREAHVARQGGDDIGPALRVQHAGRRPERGGKGLAVAAIADRARELRAGGDRAPDLAAPALDRMIAGEPHRRVTSSVAVVED